MINEDEVVAHYTRLEFLDKILGNKTIKLSPVSNFDDPRENSLGWIFTEGIGDSIEGWGIADRLKKSAGSKINILCTCTKAEHTPGDCPIESAPYGKPRMWSQYGDNSKGFCIVLNQERFKLRLKQLAEKPEYFITDKVEYVEWLHIVGGGSSIEYGDGLELNEDRLFSILNNNNMLHSIFYKKSIDWRDECEHRWLLFSDDDKPIFVSIEDCVEGIVLGCEFPPDKFDEIREYCSHLNCSCFKLSYEHPKYEISKIA